MLRVGVAVVVVTVAGAVALASAAATNERTETEALFLQGRPVAGAPFTAAISYWTGPEMTIQVSNGLCQASIRTRRGRLQHRLGGGVTTRLPDDSPISGITVWSWKVPRTAAGKQLVVTCARLLVSLSSSGSDSASEPKAKIVSVKLIRPGFAHRWKIAAP
jgi:hypothetical protein